MELAVESDVKEFTYEELQTFTNNFSEQNLIGRTLFGQLYRAKIPQGWNGMEAQDVTVKIWENTAKILEGRVFLRASAGDTMARMADEIAFLSHPSVNYHPNLVKVKGYCPKFNQLGVVFDLKSLDTVRNLAANGSFKWLHRIKVALGLARLLQFLHDQQPQYLVRNISAAHIMLDQDFNPILLDFAMLTGGVVGDKIKDEHFGSFFGSYGYVDPNFPLTGIWTEKNDIFAFGVVLLELICKCAVDRIIYFKDTGNCFLHNRARAHYKLEKSKLGFDPSKCSFVAKCFSEEPCFDARDGPEITKLAISCADLSPEPRPTMKEVVEKLQALHVVRSHCDELGV
uniref:Protein kinase domain-containing protein n=1 Tax=Davidia involucrata TaxID=16924 RepID=A0A5B7B514_DAVIN